MAEDDDTFNVIVTNVEYEKMLNESRQQVSELRTANEKIQTLENQKKGLLKQIEQLNEAIKTRDKDIQRITVDCLKLKKDKIQLQEDLEDSQERCSKQRQDELTAKIQKLVREVKQVTEKLENEAHETKKFSLKCEQLTKDIKDLEEKYQVRKICQTDSLTEFENSTKVHTGTHKSLSKDNQEKISDSHEKKNLHHHSTSQQQHPPNSPYKITMRKHVSSTKGVQIEKHLPEENLQLINSMNEKIVHLEQQLKRMGQALDEKRLENQQLVEKLKQAKKDRDDAGKQLSEALDQIEEKLQREIEVNKNALIEKDRLIEELKERGSKKAENLARQLTRAQEFIQEKDDECNKLKAQEDVKQKKIRELTQQEDANKKKILELKAQISDKLQNNVNRPQIHFLQKIFNIEKYCTSKKEFEDFKEEIQRGLNLQAEYQKLITQRDTKNRELQKDIVILKRQVDGSQRMINEIMDVNVKREAEIAVLKSDIERVETAMKQAKVSNVETENRYQIALSELREQLRKSERAQDELKTIVKIMESKDDYIDYYVNTMRTKLKEEEPRVITRIIHDDLEEFIKKLVKQIPGKML